MDPWENEAVDAKARDMKPVMLPMEDITLVEPAAGEVTSPLQKVAWAKAMRENRAQGAWGGSLEVIDRSLPRTVRFSWKPSLLDSTSVRYDFEMYPADERINEKIVLNNLREAWVEVKNLRVGVSYHWKVRALRGKQVVGESPIGQFNTHPAAPRWIHVPGITNVRDVGGWPLPDGHRVRQGLLYRGSEMNSHCAINDEGCEVMLDHLGVRTDIDLRGVGEERMPVLDTKRVEYINIPLASYDMIANPEYTGRYRTLFSLLAQKRTYPAYIHCWGGADRTGTAVFLLGALLGMRMEDLITDYELTSLSVWGDRTAESEAFREMLETLELFTKKGNSLQMQVERYLRVIGITDAEIANLKKMFIE